MIGTWNVAGQTPNEDVDLDQWLCTQEPAADMYVLGWVPSQVMKMDLFT
jgi:type I inositol polyphosphate 5-phosphatase IP5P1/2